MSVTPSATQTEISKEQATAIAIQFNEEIERLWYEGPDPKGDIPWQQSLDYNVRFQEDRWIAIADSNVPDDYGILEIDRFGGLMGFFGFHWEWPIPPHMRHEPLEAARAYFDHVNKRRN